MSEVGFLGQTVILTLVALVAAAGCVHVLAPRLRRRFQTVGHLQTLGLLTLTPQCSVALVQVGREKLVLGVTSQMVTLLTKTPANGAGEADEGEETHELGAMP
jgi:flagellar biogenesis protein FliO